MVAETQQFLQGLADKGVLGATFAVHYMDCGFVFEEVCPPWMHALHPTGAGTRIRTSDLTRPFMWQPCHNTILIRDRPHSGI